MAEAYFKHAKRGRFDDEDETPTDTGFRQCQSKNCRFLSPNATSRDTTRYDLSCRNARIELVVTGWTWIID